MRTDNRQASRIEERASSPSWRQSVARLVLSATLLGAGLYILSNYLHALAWALVLVIALWPTYERILRQTSCRLSREALPLLFVALISLVILLPVATLAVDAVRELQEIVYYSRASGDSGLPVPDFVSRLPYIGQWAADRWREHLSHAGWAKDIAQQINTSNIRQLGASLGANALHRLVLFGVSVLTLCFLFRHGETPAAIAPPVESAWAGATGAR
jgi:predicted PurR-regulated permease PerM